MNTTTSVFNWHPKLADPTGRRTQKPRTAGRTMVIDKGLGQSAFMDLLQTSGGYIDIIKLGFGTSPLYPFSVLREKIDLAKQHQIDIIPGGTFLEIAVINGAVDEYFHAVQHFGFSGIEVSDGTIEMSRELRNNLIRRGVGAGLSVYTEYGKKAFGSGIDMDGLIDTIACDRANGAELVTVEGRESGAGVGIYDEKGACKDEQLWAILEGTADPHSIMWETPLKSQQVHLLNTLGADINLGNIAPGDILSLEALRRGLRSDTMETHMNERV